MKNIKNITTKVIENPWFYPVALLLVGMLAYGLVIPYLGFYWDDWESVYLYHLHNPAIIFPYFAERPYSAFIYLILFPLTSMTPLFWQTVALVLRWIGVLFIYLTLNAVWPARAWVKAHRSNCRRRRRFRCTVARKPRERVTSTAALGRRTPCRAPRHIYTVCFPDTRKGRRSTPWQPISSRWCTRTQPSLWIATPRV